MNKLKELRLRRKKSREWLCERTGYAMSTLIRLEGDGIDFTDQMKETFAKAFRCDVEEFNKTRVLAKMPYDNVI